MRLILRILGWSLFVIVTLILLLVLSVPFDALIGRGRVAALTNMAITNPAGPEIRAFVAYPPGPGPHPAVIMIHEFWGLREEIIGKAEALAAEGYVVVAPDTFRGNSTSWLPRAIYQSIRSDVTQVNSDLDAVFAWLSSQPMVQADRIAVMGFCYGGRTALIYSLHNPETAATGIFYGMTSTNPERLRTLGGPVLGIFGGADSSIPIIEVETLENNLVAAGVPHTFRIFPDQPHAFVTSIEAIRAGGPQGEAWALLLSFLDESLMTE